MHYPTDTDPYYFVCPPRGNISHLYWTPLFKWYESLSIGTLPLHGWAERLDNQLMCDVLSLRQLIWRENESHTYTLFSQVNSFLVLTLNFCSIKEWSCVFIRSCFSNSTESLPHKRIISVLPINCFCNNFTTVLWFSYITNLCFLQNRNTKLDSQPTKGHLAIQTQKYLSDLQNSFELTWQAVYIFDLWLNGGKYLQREDGLSGSCIYNLRPVSL